MRYCDFIAEISEKSQIKPFIEADSGVRERETELYSAFGEWWQLHSPDLADLPKTKGIMRLRTDFLSSFVETLEPVGLLDRFKVTGAIASWWDEVKFELRTLAESGFPGLVDSWIDTILDALEEDEEDSPDKGKFDPLGHKLVILLLPDYLEEISEAEGKVAELEQAKEAFERGEEESGEGEEEEVTNVAKSLDDRRKELKNEIKDAQKQIKKLKGSATVKDGSSIASWKRAGKNTAELERDLAELEAFVGPIEREIEEIEAKLAPYNQIKQDLAEARKALRLLKNQVIRRLVSAREALGDEGCEKLVLDSFHEGLKSRLTGYVAAHFQQVVAVVENWWDKYRVTLKDIIAERDEAAAKLDRYLSQLGYTD